MIEKQSPQYRLTIVSDGTGVTAAQMIDAAAVQFPDDEFTVTRYKKVRSEAQIDAICDDVLKTKSLIVFTVVSPALRIYLIQKSRALSIPAVDLLNPRLVGMASHFGHEPTLVSGILHDVNESYFQRIEAMEYTIAHDDGRDVTGLEKADIVLLGISRTSKTPLSMYLSHQGWKVANIPLIEGFDIPKEVFEVDQRRVVGLTIDASVLTTIRRNRLQRLGHSRGGEYAEPERVLSEIEFAGETFRKNRRWPIFNVTGKALEETAAEIIKLMTSRGLTPRLRQKKPSETLTEKEKQ